MDTNRILRIITQTIVEQVNDQFENVSDHKRDKDEVIEMLLCARDQAIGKIASIEIKERTK